MRNTNNAKTVSKARERVTSRTPRTAASNGVKPPPAGNSAGPASAGDPLQMILTRLDAIERHLRSVGSAGVQVTATGTQAGPARTAHPAPELEEAFDHLRRGAQPYQVIRDRLLAGGFKHLDTYWYSPADPNTRIHSGGPHIAGPDINFDQASECWARIAGSRVEYVEVWQCDNAGWLANDYGFDPRTIKD